jgi:predicted enzyme related to lactoylglutathione lyase
MESNDAPSQVAEFYQRALARYGKVLDCTHRRDRTSDSRALTCESDQPDPGGMLFKSGTKDKQHLVAIEPNGGGTIFALIYVWAKGE